MSRFVNVALLATAVMAGISSVSNAATLTSEGFTLYPNGNIDVVGNNGPTGWGGAWASPVAEGFLHTVRTPTSIAYSGYNGASTPAASGGNYLNLAAGFGFANPVSVFRPLDTSAGGVYGSNGYLLSPGVIGADGKTLWGSILYSQPNPGVTSNIAGFQLEGGGTFTTDLPQLAASNLIVFRIDFGASATDTVTLFSNPNLATFDGTSGGVTSAAGDYSFNTLRLREQFVLGTPGTTGSETQYDDIRFGTSVGDVAPITAVPEPTTLGLLAAGAILALRRRK